LKTKRKKKNSGCNRFVWEQRKRKKKKKMKGWRESLNIEQRAAVVVAAAEAPAVAATASVARTASGTVGAVAGTG
jgi:hypothetical protein